MRPSFQDCNDHRKAHESGVKKQVQNRAADGCSARWHTGRLITKRLTSHASRPGIRDRCVLPDQKSTCWCDVQAACSVTGVLAATLGDLALTMTLFDVIHDVSRQTPVFRSDRPFNAGRVSVGGPTNIDSVAAISVTSLRPSRQPKKAASQSPSCNASNIA